MNVKPLSLAAVITVAVLALAATPAPAQEQPKPGGVLKVALIGEPPSLDLHSTTAVITQQITWHVYETLYTYDRSLRPDPAARARATRSPTAAGGTRSRSGRA